MKYKTRAATEITNAAKNINRAISAVANARTPSPRNPATSDTIENRTARHERIIHFLLSILIISLILASGDSPLRIRPLFIPRLVRDRLRRSTLTDLKRRIYPLWHTAAECCSGSALRAPAQKRWYLLSWSVRNGTSKRLSGVQSHGYGEPEPGSLGIHAQRL